MFPKDALQEILVKDFVEARLNTDLKPGHPHFGMNPRIQEIRAHYLGAGNIGLPQYLIVDPQEPNTVLAKRGGSTGVANFAKFFAKGLKNRPKAGGGI